MARRRKSSTRRRKKKTKAQRRRIALRNLAKAHRARRRRGGGSYIAAGRPGHVKRGCGKRNWSRGGNARWRCKVGKTHPYRRS